MQKNTQSKIAIFCLLLFSKSLFAKDFAFSTTTANRVVGGISDTSSLPRFDTGSTTSLSDDEILGPIRLPRTTGLPRLPSTSGFPSFPKPTSVPPQFGGSPTPSTPFDFGDKQISGTFGSPAEELFKGNVSNAKASCIQDAIQSGEQIEADDSSVWSFANKSSTSSISALPSTSSRSIPNLGPRPEAFAESGSCDESLEHQSCTALLGKSINDVSQAYYNSEIRSDTGLWNEVITFLGLGMLLEDGKPRNIDQALDEAQARADKASGKTDQTARNQIIAIKGKDPLITATNLIIQKIDESLANGDLESAEKANSLLKRVNPSASYSLECMDVFKENSKNDFDVITRKKGTGIGPISGADYGKIRENNNHGWIIEAIAAIAGAVIAGVAVVNYISEKYYRQKNEERAEESNDRAKQAALDARINALNSCVGIACREIYKDAAEAVDAAKDRAIKEANSKGPDQEHTPTRTNDSGVIQMPTMIIDGSKPAKGSGGNGGEMVNPDLDLHPTADHVTKPVDMRRVDPEAAQTFCNKIVSDYKHFKGTQIQNAGRPVENLPSSWFPSEPIVGTGVAHFDQWTSDFWANKKAELEGIPHDNSRANNCNSMDKVEGL